MLSNSPPSQACQYEKGKEGAENEAKDPKIDVILWVDLIHTR